MAEAANKSTALWVLRRLRAAGRQALLAGGCVRDMLLGRRCHDYDVATDATPEQVRRLFQHVLLVGAKFGVAMVIHDGRKVEVTTFRSDLSYTDGRRPDGVRFSSPREDALRRDFTINGMFWDPDSGEVIDYVGGREDLKRRLVRTIGSPQQRFAEDYLRMIRAVRFAVRLGFHMAPNTADAIASLAPRIASISGERIFDELSRMLSAESAPAALDRLAELKLAPALLGELFISPNLYAQGRARVAAVARQKDLVLSLGALLMDLPTAQIAAMVRRWGGANELRETLTWLAVHADAWAAAASMPLCELKRLMAHPSFERLRRLWRVREQAQTGSVAQARRIARRCRAIAPARVNPPPLLSGEDLKALGLRQGRLLGTIHKALYDAQLNETISTRPQALALARELIQTAGA